MLGLFFPEAADFMAIFVERSTGKYVKKKINIIHVPLDMKPILIHKYSLITNPSQKNSNLIYYD